MDEIQSRRHWIAADSIDLDSEKDDPSSTPLRLLDYACGTGLVSRVRPLPPSPKTLPPSLPP
jgi:hypothetical protein